MKAESSHERDVRHLENYEIEFLKNDIVDEVNSLKKKRVFNITEEGAISLTVKPKYKFIMVSLHNEDKTIQVELSYKKEIYLQHSF